MAVPDISRFESHPTVLRDFGRKLHQLGLTPAAASAVVAAASALPPGQRQPIRAYHLRKARTPLGTVMRMFMFEDAVTEAEARAALGDLVPALVEMGLVVSRGEGLLVSPFILGVLDGLYVLSDDLALGPDAVMGLAEGTIALCGAAFPRQPVKRVLDLGCGSGTGALLFKRCARQVTGTDINPRAVALARANAAINEISGVDLLEGDLFAPLADRTFDLVISQPPFVPRPEGLVAASFLYGGRRGDELALKVLSGLMKHLAPEGRAILFVEWPEHGDEALEDRARHALGPQGNLLVLRGPPTSLDAHAVSYAAGMHPDLGPGFEAEALVRRAHFDEQGIHALVPTLVVVERTEGPGWTASVQTEAFSQLVFSSERIDKMLAARALAGDPARLLAARLRVPENTLFAQEQVGPGAEVPSTLSARFSPRALVPRIDMNLELLGLATLVHEGATVREALERFAQLTETAVDEVIQQQLPGLEQALLYGLLEIEGA
jgi:SAM-dependent methyltransferase